MADRQSGHVKWFNSNKGYGFIIPNRTNEDLFVHYKSIMTEHKGKRTLETNEEVDFVIRENREGKRSAQDVRRLKIIRAQKLAASLMSKHPDKGKAIEEAHECVDCQVGMLAASMIMDAVSA